jgi:chromosomal replication initiation ATPase DnaA
MTISYTETLDAPPHCERAIALTQPAETTHLKLNSEVVGAVVSSIFQISKDQIFSPERGKASVAFARQTAMYLTHITCGHSYTDIGCFFGRDRTTVSHACQLIEDKREDPDIDWSLDLMEHSILSLINHFDQWDG